MNELHTPWDFIRCGLKCKLWILNAKEGGRAQRARLSMRSADMEVSLVPSAALQHMALELVAQWTNETREMQAWLLILAKEDFFTCSVVGQRLP